MSKFLGLFVALVMAYMLGAFVAASTGEGAHIWVNGKHYIVRLGGCNHGAP